jgi:CHAT domain-containing protein
VAEEARARALLALMGGRQRQRITGRAGVRTSRLRDFPDRQPDSPAQMAMGVSTSPMLDMRQMATGIEPQFQPLETDVEPPEAEPEIPQPPCLARLIYHVLPNHTAIFAVSPQGDIHHHLAPWGESQLTEQVKQLRRALQVDQQPRGVRGLFWAEEPQPETDYETILRKMYAILVEPLADHLPADGTPVAIEPHGPLWLLPFAALQTTNGTWLAEQWPLLYSPAAEVLDDIRRKPDYGTPADLRALIVGNPLMPSIPEYAGHKLELDPLPGAEQEAKAITDLFPAERVQLLRGSEATRTTIESVLVEYGILHLATHGLANADDPLASFIALAKSDQDDGLLTARRVLSRDIPADLVALSACQTGLGKISGDGMIGLSRAFLIAGARAVLVSQWSVSDEATVALMTAFYRHYINLDDKALALQQAMLEVKAVSEYAHPRFWAPFVIVGAEA